MFFRVSLVHSGAPWGVLGSSGVVGFTPVCPGGIWIHLGSFGFVWFTRERPGIVGFMLVVGFVQGRWVHSGAPWESLGLTGVVGFTWVRPWV